jgi:cytidylate kinase
MNITVSGLPGVHKEKIGRALAHRLGKKWTFCSIDDLFWALVREKQASLFEVEKSAQTNPEVDRRIGELIQQLNKSDHMVFASQLGWHFMPDSFRVLIVRTLELRAADIARRERILYEEAIESLVLREMAFSNRAWAAHKVNTLDITAHSAARQKFHFVLDTSDMKEHSRERESVDSIQREFNHYQLAMTAMTRS